MTEPLRDSGNEQSVGRGCAALALLCFVVPVLVLLVLTGVL